MYVIVDTLRKPLDFTAKARANRRWRDRQRGCVRGDVSNLASYSDHAAFFKITNRILRLSRSLR
jgi:hypothetical protein